MDETSVIMQRSPRFIFAKVSSKLI